MLTFLFDQMNVLLGEVRTEQGCFGQAKLTRAGEERFGEATRDWQSQGIAAVREQEQVGRDGVRRRVLTREQVSARSGEFLETLQAWAEDAGLYAISVDEMLLPYWQRVVRLPLDPQGRVAFLLALKFTPPGRLKEWDASLAATERLALGVV